MAGGGATADGGAEITLEYTPTWIVAAVCCVIVVISLRLKKGSKKPLYDALLKIKEELMLLGFISLLLSVFQGPAQKICVQESIMHHMLPCPLPASESAAGAKYGAAMFTGVLGGARRLLAGGGAANDYCQKKRSFFKQFYGSVTEEDYTAMRLGFVMKHCKGHPKFNFYKYMIRAFEADFKKVVGIRMVCLHMVIIGPFHRY
nr:unnamed protein product [Digitaria exilis]